MRLKSVTVKSLFGRFDHHIPINTTENITIITAPNGYGKTVLLNLITFFFAKRFSRMAKYNFASIEFSFVNGLRITIEKSEQKDLFGNKQKYKPRNLNFALMSPGQNPEPWTFRLAAGPSLRRSAPHFDQFLPFLDRIGPDEWMDDRDGESYSSAEILENFSDYFPERIQRPSKIPNWLREVIDNNECHLIETQRLLNIDGDPHYPHRHMDEVPQSVVERNARQLAEHIGAALQNYANESQKLDQSFPKRVLQKLSQLAPEEPAIRDRLSNLDNKRKQLVQAGLLDKSFSPQISTADLIEDQNIRNLLDVYASDTESKLNVFDSIYQKVSLFQEIMGAHFIFKKIQVDAKSGMSVFDDDGNKIPITDLSSGEQHELVLIYDLLFRVSENAVILIDEPELSLHVSWQKRFISDIQRIMSLRPLTVVMATHSPQIISDRWDLAVDLAAGQADELHP